MTAAGIAIAGEPAMGTEGEPLTAARCWAWFGTEMRAASAEFGVPIELLVACLCEESVSAARDRDAARTARREEPHFKSDLETPDRVSVGVAQTLIGTARRALGAPALGAADLTNPETSIRAAAAYMARKALATNYNTPLVAAAYNAGALVPEDVVGNRWKLLCYPQGTGHYIDSYVSWFNDAMRLRDAAVRAGSAPSFAVLFHDRASG